MKKSAQREGGSREQPITVKDNLSAPVSEVGSGEETGEDVPARQAGAESALFVYSDGGPTAGGDIVCRGPTSSYSHPGEISFNKDRPPVDLAILLWLFQQTQALTTVTSPKIEDRPCPWSFRPSLPRDYGLGREVLLPARSLLSLPSLRSLTRQAGIRGQKCKGSGTKSSLSPLPLTVESPVAIRVAKRKQQPARIPSGTNRGLLITVSSLSSEPVQRRKRRRPALVPDTMESARRQLSSLLLRSGLTSPLSTFPTRLATSPLAPIGLLPSSPLYKPVSSPVLRPRQPPAWLVVAGAAIPPPPSSSLVHRPRTPWTLPPLHVDDPASSTTIKNPPDEVLEWDGVIASTSQLA